MKLPRKDKVDLMSECPCCPNGRIIWLVSPTRVAGCEYVLLHMGCDKCHLQFDIKRLNHRRERVVWLRTRDGRPWRTATGG
jgi:hypothetical protein